MAAAFATASAEAEASFKDGRMYVEKLIRSPRHIEVQVLGDEYGEVVHLGERDCSVQKPSHQKLIEEAPAAALDPARARRGCTTSPSPRRARSTTPTPARSNFSSTAATCYFMEMNTRIQVEHPVTEMVYGVDLVKEQIRDRAPANRSGSRKPDLQPHGCAIEVRVNAEDPENNFAPAAGTLSASSSRAGRACASTPTSTRGRSFRRSTIRCWPRSSSPAARASRRSCGWNARSPKRVSRV